MTPTLTVQAVVISLTIFVTVYLVIFSFGTLYVYRLLRAGPVESEHIFGANSKRPLAGAGDGTIPETIQGGNRA